MSRLLAPTIWTRQPQQLATLRPEYAGGFVWTASSNRLAIGGGSPALGINSNGPALINNGGVNWFKVPDVDINFVANGATFIIVGKRYPGIDCIFAGHIGSSNNFFRFETATRLTARLGSDIYFTVPTTEVLSTYVLRIEKGATSLKAMYVGGRLTDSTTNNYQSARLNAIGCGYVSGSLPLNGELNLFAVIPFDVGDVVSKALSANPWQIFAPLPRRNYIEVGSGATNHNLTPTELATPSPILGSPLVAQDHATTASALLTGATVLGTPAVAQNHVVTASGIATAAPTLGTPILTASATDTALTATGIATAAPTLGSPAATQNHVVTASALATAAPVLGTPTLIDIPAGVIAVDGITTGAPVLGSPALTQNHVIAAGAIACGTPVFGPVTLAQQHAMLADGIVTAAPVLGTPSLTPTVPGSLTLTQADIDAIAAAVLAALQGTTIPVNVTHFNGNPTQGSGRLGDPVRPA